MSLSRRAPARQGARVSHPAAASRGSRDGGPSRHVLGPPVVRRTGVRLLPTALRACRDGPPSRDPPPPRQLLGKGFASLLPFRILIPTPPHRHHGRIEEWSSTKKPSGWREGLRILLAASTWRDAPSSREGE